MNESQYQPADSVDRPSKRQQGETPHLSPGSLENVPISGTNLQEKVHFLISIIFDDSQFSISLPELDVCRRHLPNQMYLLCQNASPRHLDWPS